MNSSDKVKKALIANLESGQSVSKSCDNSGISRDTFYRWIKDNKGFKRQVEIAQESRIKIVEDALYKKAIEGNVTAQIFFLCNRESERWRNVNKVDMDLLVKKLPDITFVPSRGRDAKGS